MISETAAHAIVLMQLYLYSQDPENWPEYAVEFFRRHSTGLVDHEIILDYDYWSIGEWTSITPLGAFKLPITCYTIEDIYDSVLPPHLPRHYSYETIGHIAHLNLREELEEYKRLIGEIILSVCIT